MRFVERVKVRVEETLKQLVGPDILHVGCAGHVVELDSPYWVHRYIHDKFPDVIGLDISQENIAQMESHGFKNLIVANAETFALGQKFDTIVAGELIEHLSNPGLFIENAKRHLKPGGRIVITTPYPFCIAYFLNAFARFPDTCPNHEHTQWFCPQTLTCLAERYELKVTHFELIEDYRFDDPAQTYRYKVRLLRLFRPLMPKKWYLNCMLFVLQVA